MIAVAIVLKHIFQTRKHKQELCSRENKWKLLTSLFTILSISIEWEKNCYARKNRKYWLYFYDSTATYIFQCTLSISLLSLSCQIQNMKLIRLKTMTVFTIYSVLIVYWEFVSYVTADSWNWCDVYSWRSLTYFKWLIRVNSRLCSSIFYSIVLSDNHKRRF